MDTDTGTDTNMESVSNVATAIWGGEGNEHGHQTRHCNRYSDNATLHFWVIV
jgi:hypothetical protein